MVDHPDLIAIQPSFTMRAGCAVCGTEAEKPERLIFQGIHTVAKYVCTSCMNTFFATLPTGHDLLFPASFGVNGSHLTANEEAKVWLVNPLLSSLFHGKEKTVAIEREVFNSGTDAIILNCLDNRFGHSFAKLWNAPILNRKYPDRSLIVFIPRSLRWLIPDCVTEVWTFDSPLQGLQFYLSDLDAEVTKLRDRFSRIWLSKAFTHLGLDKVDLRKFLRVDRFDLSRFESRSPQITFVLRQDRFWHRHLPEHFLFLVFRRLGLSLKPFVWRQNYLVNKTAGMIRKRIPGIRIAACGLGTNGKLQSFITDLRRRQPTVAEEREWCKMYSVSHVIIGVHGSNMLIPTALAAGFIEILPRHKIRHVAEDVLIDRPARYALFLGRHVDQFTSPNLVRMHAERIITDFPYLYKNAEQVV